MSIVAELREEAQIRSLSLPCAQLASPATLGNLLPPPWIPLMWSQKLHLSARLLSSVALDSSEHTEPWSPLL